jgi:murein DD-endopeptidase MepM/ murein hydrolase activator NlpD
MRIATAATAALLQLVVPACAAGSDWVWPVRGEILTGYLAGAEPYAAGQHRGIDVAAPIGEPVAAATAGTVRFAGVVGTSGLTVSIRTADGRFDTSYLHLSSAAVRAGERVTAGQAVGAAGTSGRSSTTAPHLHFGVRVAGSDHAYRDPLDLLPSPLQVPEGPRGVPVRVTAPVPLGPAPAPLAVRRAVRWARPAAALAPAPSTGRLGLPALAVGCLLALTLGVAAAGRPTRSSIGARAVLRHHADLLRQR